MAGNKSPGSSGWPDGSPQAGTWSVIMARVRYLDIDDLPEESRWLFERLQAGRGSVGNVFRALAHHPAGLRGFMVLGTAILDRGTLDPRLRELAIIRTGQLCGATYEVAHHEAIARRLGVPEEKIGNLANWDHTALYTPEERAVIRYAEVVTRDVVVPDELFERVRSFLDERGTVELTLAVAFYNLVSRFLVAMQVELEPSFASTADEQASDRRV